MKNYPLVRYETISFFSLRLNVTLVVWVEDTNCCSLEGEGISVGPGKISPHLRTAHINTNWDKRCYIKRLYKRLFIKPFFK